MDWIQTMQRAAEKCLSTDTVGADKLTSNINAILSLECVFPHLTAQAGVLAQSVAGNT